MREKKQVVDGKQQCIDCKEWLDMERFGRHSASSTGRNWRCRECHKRKKFGGMTASERARKWALENPERYFRLSLESRLRILHNPRRLAARRASIAKWYQDNQGKAHASHRSWMKKNPWSVVADRSRALVRATLLSFGEGGKRFRELVGCGGNRFREHIQSHWKEGMNWGNFGRGGWNVGHVRSVAGYRDRLMTEEGLRECFHWTNLRPEWEKENSAKFTRQELTQAQKELAYVAHPPCSGVEAF